MSARPPEKFEDSVRALSTRELLYALTVIRDECSRRCLLALGVCSSVAPDVPQTPPRIPALERARAFQEKTKGGAR